MDGSRIFTVLGQSIALVIGHALDSKLNMVSISKCETTEFIPFGLISPLVPSGNYRASVAFLTKSGNVSDLFLLITLR